MKETPIESLFHFLSKAVIIIPISVIIGAIIFKFVPDRTKSTQVSHALVPTATAAPTPKSNFNLDGPLVCNIEQQDASISAMIKNKQVAANLDTGKTTTHLLLKGDCLYSWEDATRQGSKICGLSTVINIFSMMPGMANTVDPFSLMSKMMPSAAKTASGSALSASTFSDLTKSCKTAQIEDNTFDLPKNKTFIDVSAVSPTVVPSQK